MTKQEKLKELEQEIIKANPSILDLKFGCIIRKNKDHCITSEESEERPIFISISEYGSQFFWAKFDKYEAPQAINTDEFDIEIIGRPIRLSDVLYMFLSHAISEWSVNSSGAFERWKYHGEPLMWELKEYGPAWKMNQDDLSLQSEDTIDFLFNLIENK